jgi:hypothetical protein
MNQNFGIRGFSVNNFTLEYSTVGSPTPTNAATIADNLQGTNTGGIGEGAISTLVIRPMVCSALPV